MADQSSSIYRAGSAPNTRLLNTLKVKITATDSDGVAKQIGLVQAWTPSHARTITANRGIGFGDQIAELSVGITELTASAGVLGMYTRNIMQVFGYKAGSTPGGIVRSLKHHKWPFDVKEEIFVPDLIKDYDSAGYPTGGVITTWYEGCWMSSWEHSFEIGDVNVSETAAISITDITDGTGYWTENSIDTEFRSRIFGQ